MVSGAKIIITGAAGFIGSHLGERLLKDGHEVVGIDNLNDYYSPLIKKHNLSILEEFAGFQFAKLDIRDEKTTSELIKKVQPDFLIHAAARAGVRESLKNPLIYTQVNVLGSQIILEALRRCSPQTRSVFLSSSSVYGIQDTVPFDEEMAPNPQSPYALTKSLMEQLAEFYHRFYGLPLVIVRPFSIYGPRGRPDMAPLLLIKAAEKQEPFTKFGANEDNQRDWTYIDDFVDGVMGLLEKHDFLSFEIFNLGRGEPVGIDDFVATAKKLIKENLNQDLKVVRKKRGREELPVTYAKISKAQKRLGYHPQTGFEKGLGALLRFYRDHPRLYRHS